MLLRVDPLTIIAIIAAVACGIVEITGVGSCLPTEAPAPTQQQES